MCIRDSIYGVERLFLQRNVQQWIKDPVYVTDRFVVSVDYAKKRCFRVSDWNVLQNIAVDVNRINTSSQIRRIFSTISGNAVYNACCDCNPTDGPDPD